MDSRDLLLNQMDMLVELVCFTSIWAPIEIVEKLKTEQNNDTASWFLNTRRFKPGNGETRRIFVNGIYLDDNVCANSAIKKAVGIKSIKNFTTCHIYEQSTYEHRYHTSIPNLVLVPNTLYALTDNSEQCKAFLKYISFKRYGFYIDKEPESPLNWNDKVLDSIRKSTSIEINAALNAVERRNSQKFKDKSNKNNC